MMPAFTFLEGSTRFTFLPLLMPATTALLHYCTTPLLHYSTTLLLYYCTTRLLHSITVTDRGSEGDDKGKRMDECERTSEDVSE